MKLADRGRALQSLEVLRDCYIVRSMSFRVSVLVVALAVVGCASQPPKSAPTITVHPAEDPNVILHNPGMGWVLYENYPIDQAGSSTMAMLPNEDFPQVDAVAVMFSWADVEKQPDQFDFSKVDVAYDYWRKRGKEIQLRMSTESLLFWSKINPPTGLGVPQYVLEKLPAEAKQKRTDQGFDYVVVDARNAYYRERVKRFLDAVNKHFDDASRPVTLVDLRGYGLWGEWHSGFKYESLEARHAALVGIIDLWCEAFPDHKLALSASYDPDSPPELRAGPTDHYDEAFTKTYPQYLYWSAFDYALTKPQITWRRDGAGGAVHSNERKLLNEAHALGRGPFVSEFVGGYGDFKKRGQAAVEHAINDALSLHPNYVNALGWAVGDALAFIREQPDLFNRGLRTMGYRLVPTQIQYPKRLRMRQTGEATIKWINRGVGQVLENADACFSLFDSKDEYVAASSTATVLRANAVSTGSCQIPLKFSDVKRGNYSLCLSLHGVLSRRQIKLPLKGEIANGVYKIGMIHIEP
jgi:hypothetical protein